MGLPVKTHTYVVGTVTNCSDRPLLDVRFETPADPAVRLAELPHVENNVEVAKVVAARASFSAYFDVEGPFTWTTFLNLHVCFTDANGVRWRRTEYIPPQEIEEPPIRLRIRLEQVVRLRGNAYRGSIDDFYDSAIGAYEKQGGEREGLCEWSRCRLLERRILHPPGVGEWQRRMDEVRAGA